MSRLSLAIVDDEPPARQLLRELVSKDERFEVVAICEGGREAIDAIASSKPDLVLLDVQMPEVDGFDVLSALQDPLPATIMVTAFSEYAVRAFDYHAVDYILKPVDKERLQIALDRAVRRIREASRGTAGVGIRGLARSLRGDSPRRERITLKCGSSFLFLKPDELRWAEAAGNYIKIEVQNRTHLLRDSIAGLMDRLDPSTFIRIHRSYVVNASLIIEARLQPGGSDYVAVLRDGTMLPIGRSYRAEVLSRLRGRSV